MPRRYHDVWEQIKKYKKVTVKCKANKVATIVQAVQKEKARENAPRAALELPTYGKLEIKQDKEKGEIVFRLVSMELSENL